MLTRLWKLLGLLSDKCEFWGGGGLVVVVFGQLTVPLNLAV